MDGTKRSFLAAGGGMAALLATGGLIANASPLRSAAPGFEGALTWLNSAPLTQRQLRGKVVLVDFWTYSCINCIRTIPYLRAWADKYRSAGLVVVGVHTPEFKFEQDLSNVSAAIERFKIGFPVAVDSNQRIWEAWGNRAWPAFYLVDAEGKLRHRQLGEGGYDKLERAIQSLLAEARGAPVDTSLADPAMSAEQAQPDLGRLDSAEAYIGHAQARNFGSPERVRAGAPHSYSVGKLGLNQWGLRGQWAVHGEFARAAQPGSGVAIQFSARDLHLVMGAGAARKMRIKVTLDGRAPGADHGADIDAAGDGVITGTRLYQLIRQSGVGQPGVEQARRFDIRFIDAGAEAYAFTFG